MIEIKAAIIAGLSGVLVTLGLSWMTLAPFIIWLIVICTSALVFNYMLPKDKRKNPWMVVAIGLGTGLLFFNTEWAALWILKSLNIYAIAGIIGCFSCLIKEIILAVIQRISGSKK